ncbi:MAG: molybdate ABC transporter substrate-binding protein [Planctomycetota bacterium]|jgi:molybdate transport system substrate-binding protein|nr:molybdate ABC transporter substrate-binding protein [Planctomycetota bacterium]MDP6941611.1 molybdate ABC transporter substrate-binding protein [Planctomycetota bacterium]
MRPGLLSLAIVLSCSPKQESQVRIAVASNFTETMAALADCFEGHTGEKIVLVSGSSGKHFAQILNGAPFDAFFSADTHRPERLEQDGVGVLGSRFTYAKGRLVLWCPKGSAVQTAQTYLTQSSARHLAIGNPELAPYGGSAKSYLLRVGLWENWKSRLVYGENIAQTFQFVASGNAELGLVSAAQVKKLTEKDKGALLEIPESRHDPILQQAILLNDRPAARKFFDFVQTNEAKSIIQDYGYSLP